MERIGRSKEEGKTKQGREPSKINGFLQLQMRRIDFASGRQRKEREFRGAFPRHPIDLLAGNVSIDSGDIFVNRPPSVRSNSASGIVLERDIAVRGD